MPSGNEKTIEVTVTAGEGTEMTATITTTNELGEETTETITGTKEEIDLAVAKYDGQVNMKAEKAKKEVQVKMEQLEDGTFKAVVTTTISNGDKTEVMEEMVEGTEEEVKAAIEQYKN